MDASQHGLLIARRGQTLHFGHNFRKGAAEVIDGSPRRRSGGDVQNNRLV